MPDNGDKQRSAEWNKWRGEVTANLESIKKEIGEVKNEFKAHSASDEQHLQALYVSLNEVKIKLAKWAGMAIVLGGVLGGIGSALIENLFAK